MNDIFLNGQSILEQLEISPSRIRALKPAKRSHYRAIINWLSKDFYFPYQTNLDKLKKALEVLEHFCSAEAWEEAIKIFYISLNTPNQESFNEILATWGYYDKVVDFSNKLYGKLDLNEDASLRKISGVASRYLRNEKQTKEYLENALLIYKKENKTKEQADVLHELGLMMADFGKNEKALEYYKQSLSLYNDSINYQGIAQVLNDIGRAKNSSNNYFEAEKIYANILEIYNEHLLGEKRKSGYAWILYNYGKCLTDQGKFDEAINLLEESLEIFKEIGLRNGIAYSLDTLTTLKINNETIPFQNAVDDFQEARNIFHEIGNEGGVSQCLHSLGKLTLRQKQYDLANRYFQEQLIIWDDMKNLSQISFALEGIGYLAIAQNDPHKAAYLLGFSENIREEENFPLPILNWAEHESYVNTACSLMGEINFSFFKDLGKKMSLSKIIDLAREQSIDKSRNTFENLSDEQLLALTALQMDGQQDERLHILLDKQQADLISEKEILELEKLIQIYENGLLQKANALKESVRRGLMEPLES